MDTKETNRIECLEKAENIYIYGYSNLGRNVFHKLKMIFPDKLIGFVVTKYNIKTKDSERTDIYELEYVVRENKNQNILFIIATNKIFHSDIIGALRKIECQYIVYDEMLNAEINAHIPVIPKIETRLLALSVGQACNYKCRDCLNFAPYALPENKRYSLENIKHDIKSAMLFFERIDVFHIQGGEPFLYKDLGDVIEYVRQFYSHIVRKIVVATNGSILPSDALLKVIKDNEVEIRISDYKNEHNNSILIGKLFENDIKYRVYKFAGGTGTWKMGGGIKFVDTQYKLEEKVNACSWNCCFTMENGKIGRCARSIPASTLQKFNIAENDYIELRHHIDQEQIWEYFAFISPMTCCNYCKGSFGEDIEPAIQLED